MSDERGFTLIEVLVTMTLLAVGVVALVGTFDYSRKSVTASEANEVAAHRAELELERAMALDFDALALPSTPAGAGDPDDPNYYVSGSNYQWDQGSTGPRSDPLVVDPVKSQLTNASTWSDGQGRLSGTVYRYVTSVAGAGGKAKRVTVAVKLNGNVLRKPVLAASIKSDPKATS